MDAGVLRGTSRLAGIQYFQYKGYYNGETYYKLALRIYA